MDFLEDIVDKIRVFFFYLGVHLSPPIMLLGLIYTMGLVLWRIFKSIGESVTTVYPTIFTIVVSFLFLAYIIHLSFPPTKRVKIIVDAYGNNPRFIPFIAKKVECWLKNIVNFMEKQPNIEEVIEAIEDKNTNRLEELQKKNLKPKSIKRLSDRLEKKGKYLDGLIRGVSESFQIPRESIEELINTKVEVNQKINKEIFSSYDEIKANLGGLASIVVSATPFPAAPSPDEIINYHQSRIRERIEYLKSKRENIKTQIEWLKELDKRKEDIPDILEKIIKEPSTGKAVSNLSRLLFKKAKTIEDLIWVTRFANSRKGFKIGELLGLEIMKGVGNETLNWYNTQISKENLHELEGFLESFDRKRNKALEEMWQKFKAWNERTNKIDLTQPISIGLISGYSAALKRILQGICNDGGNIRLLRIILIKSSESHGYEELLKAELMANYPGLKCDIVPIEILERSEMQREIDNIFVGIESINKQGDIVHPRGGSEVIRKIRAYRGDISEGRKKDPVVYAFGESYKVMNFAEDDIDNTKLLLFRYKNIHYVVTDYGVHERKVEKLERDEELKYDLDCCARSWRENYIG